MLKEVYRQSHYGSQRVKISFTIRCTGLFVNRSQKTDSEVSKQFVTPLWFLLADDIGPAFVSTEVISP